MNDKQDKFYLSLISFSSSYDVEVFLGWFFFVTAFFREAVGTCFSLFCQAVLCSLLAVRSSAKR